MLILEVECSAVIQYSYTNAQLRNALFIHSPQPHPAKDRMQTVIALSLIGATRRAGDGDGGGGESRKQSIGRK